MCSMSSSAGQDCTLCGYFTLNFDPLVSEVFVEKGISYYF